MSLSTSLTFKSESNAFFCKKCWTSANENDYYCLAIRKTLAENLKARHCSHCFQYYLASRVLAFFCFRFSQADLLFCPREVLVLRQMQNCLMRYAYQAYKPMPFCVGRIRRSGRIRHDQSALCQQSDVLKHRHRNHVRFALRCH